MAVIFLLEIRNKKPERVKKDREYFLKRRYIKKLLGFQLFAKTNKMLKEAGNPMGMDIGDYVFFVGSAFVTAAVIGFKEGIFKGMSFFLLIVVPLHLIIYKQLSNARNKVLMSLCDIQDIFYFQSKIGTATDVIFANASGLVKGPLKEVFEEISTKYKITKDIDAALDILIRKYDMMEIKAFCIILKQKERTGYSEENHKAQSAMMKRNKRIKRRLERQIKRRNLVIASIMLFCCYVLLVAVPILTEVFMNVDRIMR